MSEQRTETRTKVGEVPGIVIILEQDLYDFLGSKKEELRKIFSNDDLNFIRKISLELAKEGFLPSWFFGYSSDEGVGEIKITCEVGADKLRDGLESDFLKLAAKKMLAQTQPK